MAQKQMVFTGGNHKELEMFLGSALRADPLEGLLVFNDPRWLRLREGDTITQISPVAFNVTRPLESV